MYMLQGYVFDSEGRIVYTMEKHDYNEDQAPFELFTKESNKWKERRVYLTTDSYKQRLMRIERWNTQYWDSIALFEWKIE